MKRGAANRIETPVLSLMGALDGCIAPAVAEGQDRFCAALEAEVVDGVGHFLHFEAPDAIAERVAGFFGC
jgi:pimeloyl-ACP methyl ester carboxylesterase